MTRIEFLTRAGCSLCDTGRQRVGRVAGLLGIEVVDIDVDMDAALSDEFGGRVPVVRMPAGEVLAEGRLSAGPLAARLLRLRLGGDRGPGGRH